MSDPFLRIRRWSGVCIRTLALSACTLAAATCATAAAAAESNGEVLVLTGPTATLSLTPEQWQQLPRTAVVMEEGGEQVEYSGVALSELLRLVEVPQGESLRGSVLSSYLLAQARDDYVVLFSLWETDPTLSGRSIVVADRRNGLTLNSIQGPLRLIVPSDPVMARSVRMLSRLEYFRAP